jgi:transcriptional regulator with XRE-family HTH domain
MEFKERLKELRKRKGLSQVALSERLGLSKSTIGAYETGDISPSLEALNLIADFFNVDIDYLLGKDDGSMYYLDPEAAELAKEVFEREELKVLFDAAKDVSKEDIEVVIRIIEGLKK